MANLTEERTTHVSFSGDLDIQGREAVRNALPPPESTDRVVIDCSEVTSMDSSVVTVIMRYRRRFLDAGHDPFGIVLIASAPVRRVLDITGLTKVLTVINAPDSKNSAE